MVPLFGAVNSQFDFRGYECEWVNCNSDQYKYYYNKTFEIQKRVYQTLFTEQCSVISKELHTDDAERSTNKGPSDWTKLSNPMATLRNLYYYIHSGVLAYFFLDVGLLKHTAADIKWSLMVLADCLKSWAGFYG